MGLVTCSEAEHGSVKLDKARNRLLPACYPGDKHKFAVCCESFQQRGLDYNAIDGDGVLCDDCFWQGREALAQFHHQIQISGRGDLEFACAIGITLQISRKYDFGHALFSAVGRRLCSVPAQAASMAASNLDGDNGKSYNRVPAAWLTAVATAGMGGQIGTSPTPRTPYG